jgi:3-hydroxy-3-methylglutaryl CoA synthase
MTVDFDYRDIAVRCVPHFAEKRYGIHLKDTNEFGLYGYFVSDDGRIYDGYYQSDQTFQQERYLNVLNDVAKDYRNRLGRASDKFARL